MRQKLIEKMRADFILVADHRIEIGAWSEQDRLEISAAIKSAIESGDANQLAMWSSWLADLACWTTAWNLIGAPINELIMLATARHKANPTNTHGTPPTPQRAK